MNQDEFKQLLDALAETPPQERNRFLMFEKAKANGKPLRTDWIDGGDGQERRTTLIGHGKMKFEARPKREG